MCARSLLERDVIVDWRPKAGVRLSPHFYTTDEELDVAVAAIDERARRLGVHYAPEVEMKTVIEALSICLIAVWRAQPGACAGFARHSVPHFTRGSRLGSRRRPRHDGILSGREALHRNQSLADAVLDAAGCVRRDQDGDRGAQLVGSGENPGKQ
jgi:hypothetical protein